MTLTDHLTAERQRLDALAAPLREQLGAIERELIDVNRALVAISGDVIVRRARRSNRDRLTIKEMALQLLTTQFDASGATTAELQTEMLVIFGRDVKRECLSPQMSRLVDSGDVIHEGKRWLLTARHALVTTGLTQAPTE